MSRWNLWPLQLIDDLIRLSALSSIFPQEWESFVHSIVKAEADKIGEAPEAWGRAPVGRTSPFITQVSEAELRIYMLAEPDVSLVVGG